MAKKNAKKGQQTAKTAKCGQSDKTRAQKSRKWPNFCRPGVNQYPLSLPPSPPPLTPQLSTTNISSCWTRGEVCAERNGVSFVHLPWLQFPSESASCDSLACDLPAKGVPWPSARDFTRVTPLKHAQDCPSPVGASLVPKCKCEMHRCAVPHAHSSSSQADSVCRCLRKLQLGTCPLPLGLAGKRDWGWTMNPHRENR